MYADAEPARSITVRLPEHNETEDHNKIHLSSRKKKEEKRRMVICASEESRSENESVRLAESTHKRKKRSKKIKTKQMYADVENPRRKKKLVEEIDLIDEDSEEEAGKEKPAARKKRIVRRVVKTDTTKAKLSKRKIILDDDTSTVKQVSPTIRNRQASPIAKQRQTSSGIFSYENLKVRGMNADSIESERGFQGNKQRANKWGHDGFFALSDDSKKEGKKKRKITVVASSEENDESYPKNSKRTKSQIQLVDSKEVSRGALKGSIHNDDWVRDRKQTAKSQVVAMRRRNAHQ